MTPLRRNSCFRSLFRKTGRAGWLMLLVPALALAEPGVSGAPITILWIVAIALSVLAAWLVTKLIVRLTGIRDKRYRWGVTIILSLVFAIFLAPFFVVFGAIFLTGRTM